MMERWELANKLQIHPETVKALQSLKLNEMQFSELNHAFSQSDDAFAAVLQKYSSAQLVALWIYLEQAVKCAEKYRRLGICEQIYLDTMKELTIWSDDYRRKTGLPGVAAWAWLRRVLLLRIFRLGRLEFEREVLEYDIVANEAFHPAGTEILEVHIPVGEPLDMAQVHTSIRAAKSFFLEHFEKEYSLLRCRSWLLAPELKRMLSETSRILQFQSQFTIYKAVPHRQAEERVFGFLSDDPSVYPENTSLQRRLKAFLLTGEKMTLGCGIITIQ